MDIANRLCRDMCKKFKDSFSTTADGSSNSENNDKDF